MQHQFYRIISLIMAIMLMLHVPLKSGTTGKIAGTVIDQQTGDPLAGANIIVEDTDMGAAADIAGNFTILHVPPGTYNVLVSVMGYAKMTIEDVRVRIDQTARVDAELQMEAIDGETVTIVADRLGIKEDVATSVISVTAQEVESLPVSDVGGVLGMQAGIKWGFNIRGSGEEAALFLLDGVTMRDPRNNKALTKVALSAVKEINVERGGVDAEYGQVQSGLINVVTMEGSKSGYHGSFTGKVTPPAPKYNRGAGIHDVHDPDSWFMRRYLDDAVCWTGTADVWDAYTRKEYGDFQGWNRISENLLLDNDPTNDLTPLGAQRVWMYETRKEQPNNLPDYDIDAGFGGPVPFVSEMLGDLRFFTSYRKERDVLIWPLSRPDYSDYDWNMQLISDISDAMKLRITGMAGNIATQEHNWWFGLYPRSANDVIGVGGGGGGFDMWADWAFSITDIAHRAMAAKLTHTLNQNTLYEVSVEYLQRSYNSRPPAIRDTSIINEVLPGFYRDTSPFGYWPPTTDADAVLIGPGLFACRTRDFTQTSSTTVKADITSQVNFYNLVKAGAEFVYNDLDLDYGYIKGQTGGFSDLYDNRIQMRTFPIRAALYAQDKLETKGFTLKAGLRLDYSNSKTDWWNTDPYDPYFITSKYTPDREFSMRKSKGQWQLSPRLGVSHPITENSKLFFNYGHFKQMPQYETLFRIDRSGATRQLQRIGDPDLILAKTISYELGYDHILLDDYLIQMAAFYRDITDQQDETEFNSINGDEYNLTTSNRYEDIRGLELTFRKTMGRWFSGFANYTYQVTTSGNFGQAERYEDPAKQKQYDENTVNLYQQRPKPSPYARANLSFYTPEDFGFRLAGHPVLGGWLLNVLLDWSQGGWDTWNPKGAKGIENNIQYVDWFNTTARISKTVNISKVRIQFMADIGNIFNTLRLRDTGSRDYRMSLHLPKSNAYDNIPGNDKLGDFRKPGVDWQPMEYRAVIDKTQIMPSDRPIYYEGSTGEYWKFSEDAWVQMDQKTIDRINSDKAYIFNPGPSTYWFTSPRTVTFGIRLSLDLNP
ncbi:TonB-dependent receptor [bacterium]|nr:TonB-dependent receptor [bacterium]